MSTAGFLRDTEANILIPKKGEFGVGLELFTKIYIEKSNV